MAAEGADLALDLAGDVDHFDLLTGRAGAEHDPDLVDRPRLEPRGEQLRVGERVAGVGVDRGPRRLSGGHVVGMAAVDRRDVDGGRLGDHHLRAHLADHARHRVAELEVEHDLAVDVTEEHEVGDPDFRSRLGLLLTPDRGHARA